MRPIGASSHRHRTGRAWAALLIAALACVAVPTAAAAKGVEDLDRVGIRESEDGVALRLYEGRIQGVTGVSDEGLPAECFPDTEVQVQLSTRELAVQAWFGVRRSDEVEPVAQVVGVLEDSPVAVVVARAPKGAASARMDFVGGGVDEAEPLDQRWVVLATRLDEVPTELERVPLLNRSEPAIGRLTYLDADGERLASQKVTGSGFDADCQPPPPPPPPLPVPTGPPPADEPGARAAVEKAYTAAFAPGADREDRLELIEDGESVREASEEIAARYPEIGPTSVAIDEIVFLDETEAAVRFDILLDGALVTATSVGRALLIDGTWKVAKATYCELLGRGGVLC